MVLTMTVHEFIAKWRKVELKERSAAQEHFLDLCHVFGHPTPAAADPTDETFCFEKGAAKHGGGEGFADVWKRGFFGWEYKVSTRISPPPHRSTGAPSIPPSSARSSAFFRWRWNWLWRPIG